MPIIGFNFEKIAIERKNQVTGKINVKNNAIISSVEEEETPFKDKDNSVIKCAFEFNTVYEPDIAEITLKGNILYLDDTKKIKNALKSWKKNNMLDEPIQMQVLNTILAKCHIKSLMLIDDLNLPPNIGLPRLTPKKKEEDYIG